MEAMTLAVLRSLDAVHGDRSGTPSAERKVPVRYYGLTAPTAEPCQGPVAWANMSRWA